MKSTTRQKSGYIPSLDGWRALAILAVIMVHDQVWRIGPYTNQSFQRLGSYGVALFFAISGLLIVTRILEEEDLTGAFHLKRFYIRRLFRIQPAALVYLSTIALLMLCHIVHDIWYYWLGAVFLYENFLYHETAFNNSYSFFVGHFWTLALEEHFYLLISLFLFFVRRRRLVTLLGLLAVVKIIQVIAYHYTPFPDLRRSYWQIHFLLIPSVAALLLRVPSVRSAATRWLQPVAVILLTAVVSLYLHHVVMASAVFVFWVVATMLHPRSLVTRFLETAPLRFFGRLSYSIYLWHVLFFNRSEVLTNITSPTLLFLSQRPTKYIATILCAMASYYWIEKPLIRLGHRLAPPATAGHADLTIQPKHEATAL